MHKCVLALLLSLSAFAAVAANPKFTWTGGGTPVDGYYLWGDPKNWQGETIPTVAATGGGNAGHYDFSAAVAGTQIKVNVATSHHMGALTFGENQGTISFVQGNESDSAIKSFSAGTITVPAGTTVDFGLNCAENNDMSGATLKFTGGGTFNFCASGAFSANRWKLYIDDQTTVGLNCSGANVKFDSVVVEFARHTAKLSLGCDVRIAAIKDSVWGRGQVQLNGHKLMLTGGNAGHTGNFDQYAVYVDAGDIEISGGNNLTNVYADSFKDFSGDVTLKNANLANVGVAFPATTDVKIGSSGVLTLSNDQTVATLTGEGLTGGVDVFKDMTLVVTGTADDEKAYRGRLMGDGSFVKNGSDTFVLSGDNTLKGTTSVRGGTLSVVGSAAAGSVTTALYRKYRFEDELVDDAGSAGTVKFSYNDVNMHGPEGSDHDAASGAETNCSFCAGRNGTRGVELFDGAGASVKFVGPASGDGFDLGTGPFTATVWMIPSEGMKNKKDRMGENRAWTDNNAIFFFGSGNNGQLVSFKVYTTAGTHLNFSAGDYYLGDVVNKFPDYGFTYEAADFYDGGWHMVTVTYDGNGTFVGYYDGQPIGSKTLPNGERLNLNGRCHLGWGNYGNLSGKFDDFKILSRCQTAVEIASEYRGEVQETDAYQSLPAPVAHWTFDDAANPGKDSSDNAYDLTADKSASPIRTTPAIVDVPGASGRALAPSNAYHWAGATFPERFPSGGASWTLSVRCALKDLKEGSKYLHPMAFMWGENNNPQYAESLGDNDRRYFGVQFDNNNYRANYLALHYQNSKWSEPNLLFKEVSYQPVFSEANWVHLVVTYKSGALTAYVDGVQTSSAAPTMRIEPTNILVGYRPDFAGTTADHPYRYFPGYIDDIAVWDVTLSAEQVAAYVRGLRTGSVGSPLSADSELNIFAGATVEVNGTGVTAKQVTGEGALVLNEHSALTVGGGSVGTLTGLGQLTVSAPLKAASAVAYYGNVVLSGSGTVDFPGYAAAVTLPDPYAVALDSVAALPLVRTSGTVTFPAEGTITFPSLPEEVTDTLVAEAGRLVLPADFTGWTIEPDNGNGLKSKLYVRDGKVYLKRKPASGLILLFR